MLKPVTCRTILVVEDDIPFADSLKHYFEKKGNKVYHTKNLAETKQILQKKQFDAIILDIILPDGEGTNLFTTADLLPPTIILSTLGTEHDMLEGLTAGALDYIVKPCSFELIEARLSLRLLPKKDSFIILHELKADVVQREVHYMGHPITLTGCEFNILWFLMSHSGQFFTAASLYENVWEMPSLSSTTIKYHISNLRKKIKAFTNKDLIVTEFGKGYSFVPEN